MIRTSEKQIAFVLSLTKRHSQTLQKSRILRRFNKYVGEEQTQSYGHTLFLVSLATKSATLLASLSTKENLTSVKIICQMSDIIFDGSRSPISRRTRIIQAINQLEAIGFKTNFLPSFPNSKRVG